MKSKLVKTFAAGLTTIILGCTNLSTPKDTTKTFLKEIKSGNDPIAVCGYTERKEDLSFFYAYVGDFSREAHKQNLKEDAEFYKNRFHRFVENCLPDMEKCVDYNGPYKNNSEFEGIFHTVTLNYDDSQVNVFLQKESDGKWKINGIYGPR